MQPNANSLAQSLYVAIVYGYLYLLFTTLTPVFESQYHFSSGSVGLTYLGIGIGALFGVVIFGILSDKLLKYLTAKHGGVGTSSINFPPLLPPHPLFSLYPTSHCTSTTNPANPALH